MYIQWSEVDPLSCQHHKISMNEKDIIELAAFPQDDGKCYIYTAYYPAPTIGAYPGGGGEEGLAPPSTQTYTGRSKVNDWTFNKANTSRA